MPSVGLKDVILQRQRLRSKEAHQSVKECIERLWNNSKEVPQHQIAKAFQLTSKFSEKLEMTRCVRNQAEDLY